MGFLIIYLQLYNNSVFVELVTGVHFISSLAWSCDCECYLTGKLNRQGAKNRHRTERTSSQSGSCKTPPREHRTRHQSMSELTKSPSSERGPKKNSVDLRARYWKFLFDNFQRAVDGIYQTCEQDESVVECKVCKLAACFPSDKIMKIS